MDVLVLQELLERLCGLQVALGSEGSEFAAWRVVDDVDMILVEDREGAEGGLEGDLAELLRSIRSAAARAGGLPDKDWYHESQEEARQADAGAAGTGGPADGAEDASGTSSAGVMSLIGTLGKNAPSLSLSPGSLPVPSPAPILEFVNKVSGILKTGQQQALKSPLADRIVRLRSSLADLLSGSQKLSSARLMLLYELLLRLSEETLGGAADWSSYNWDFDTYLYEDLPPALEYIQRVSSPHDGKVLAIGHSMGGILLYARLAALGEQRGAERLHAGKGRTRRREEGGERH